MAVHVIPYNPWREQLALTALGNVAGDIIGDMWKAHRQNEQNRKANAFRGQLQQDLQNTAQDNISLMPQKAPTGYNANPWAAAFHQGNNPIAQFDIGTSAIGKTPSLQDIARASDTLAASKRFSMLDPKTVNDIRDNMMRNTIGDMFGNADDITGQMNALTRGAAMGLVAPQVLTAFGPWARDVLSPYTFHESDLGQKKMISALNKITGTATPGLIMPVSVSPDTAATVQGSKDVANIHAGATRDAANINAQGDYARAQATIHAKQLENWQKEYDALKAEIDNDITNLADIKNEKDRAIVQGVIAQKQKRLAQLEQMMAGGYQATGTPGAGTATGNQANSNNVWFSMVGSPEGISIHPHGTFGYNRVDHKHGGIDIVVDEGSDITTRPEMGDTFIVKEARKSNSYGNTIVIESNRKFNGKTVQFRYAHMQDGSLNLKPGQTIKAGDIVGKVGSTGRSSGPHLHFEVIVDGQKVDPSAFFQIYTPDNPTQPQKATNVSALRDSQPTAQETPQTTTQGQTKSDVTAWVNEYDPAVYIETSDGKSYSKNEIEQIAKAQGLTLEQWLKKNNVQSYPDWGLPAFMENVRKWVPTDPVAYMYDQYGNYLTQDEFQREAARKNISAEVYENQLRAQGFRKSGEDFSNDTAAAPVTALSDSQSVPPFPVNYRDHNRRNFATHTAENSKAGVAPAWSSADWLNRYINTENTMRPPAGIQPAQNNLYHIPGFNVSGNPFSAMLPAVAQGGGGNQAQFITSALGHPILGDFSNIYGTGNITGNNIFRVMPPFSVLTPENYRRFYGLP